MAGKQFFFPRSTERLSCRSVTASSVGRGRGAVPDASISKVPAFLYELAASSIAVNAGSLLSRSAIAARVIVGVWRRQSGRSLLPFVTAVIVGP